MENLEDFRGLEEVQEEEVVEDIQEDNQEDLKQIIEQNNDKIDLLVDSLVNSDQELDTSAETLAAADVQALLAPLNDNLEHISDFLSLIFLILVLMFANSLFVDYRRNARFKRG